MSNLYCPYFAVMSTVSGSALHIWSIWDIVMATGEMLNEIFTRVWKIISNNMEIMDFLRTTSVLL